MGPNAEGAFFQSMRDLYGLAELLAGEPLPVNRSGAHKYLTGDGGLSETSAFIPLPEIASREKEKEKTLHVTVIAVAATASP